jgi:tRNA(adenine34) deaminase
MNDEKYMQKAMNLAAAAEAIDEIPVGAVIVKDNNIIGTGFNRNRSENDPTMHAEIIAIKEAAIFLQNERLTGCEIYVTKEPCSMCAGAIVHARLKRVIIGAEDIKYGACGTVFNICGNRGMNHVPEISKGVLQEQCASLLTDFFQRKRKNSRDINPDKETQGSSPV